MSYFHMEASTLSSAKKCFTCLFGMGSSGSKSLLSLGKLIAPLDIYSRCKESKTYSIKQYKYNYLINTPKV